MRHELWKEVDGYMFCFAGPLGDQARSMLEPGAEMFWTVEADSHDEAMSKYYEYMDWGEYHCEFEEDRHPYPAEWVSTQK